MLLVDDHLAARALSGRRMVEWGDEVPVLPWMLHVRLLRSWLDSSTRGSLSAEASTDALRAALAPSPQVLRILDPRPYAAGAVQLMLEQKVSLLAAELLSAAIANRASLYLL